jgi:molecular chaperone GrpE
MTSEGKPVPPETAPEQAPEHVPEHAEHSPADEVPVPVSEAGAGEAPDAGADSAARLREAEDRYVRLYAEFENYKKRTARENEDYRRYANEGVLKDMLPVLDNFERAVSHAKEAGGKDAGGLLEGVELIRKQFLDVLGKLGVSPIEAMGKPFDPQVHQAVSQREAADAAPGTVVDELQRGFYFRERVLRPAMVVVARAPEGAGGTAEGL